MMFSRRGIDAQIFSLVWWIRVIFSPKNDVLFRGGGKKIEFSSPPEK
jgi:hypothetical protein